MKLRRRKVVKILSTTKGPAPAFAPRYVLLLECGHEVKRRGVRGKKEPTSTKCEQCEMALDRLELAEGWASARDLKIPIVVLRFLKAEGLVNDSMPPHGTNPYWRIKR
uniref:Uncharacterized protein n=1 Tax=viral metagenome TaxID=1070528 RepID=A0A6H1Z966_9ZZZZ